MSLRVTMADAIGLRHVVSNTSRVRRAPGGGHPGLASPGVVDGAPNQSQDDAVCSLEGDVLRRSLRVSGAWGTRDPRPNRLDKA